MAKAEFCLKVEWKDFSLDMNAVHAWMQANAGEQYCGTQATEASLELWFLADPGQEIIDDIAAYWGDLDEESDEAEAYQSLEDRRAEMATKAASGKAKLAALGLTEDEIAALLG